MNCEKFFHVLGKLTKFRLHTGNINSYLELKQRRFKDSAEELAACLDIQLRSHHLPTEIKDNSTLLLCDNADLDTYERADLKYTFKVFLSSWEPEELKDSLTTLTSELNTKSIELLIIAPPELDFVEGESDEQELARWSKTIKPLWTYVNELVNDGLVASIGISEATVPQLQCLVDDYDVRPTVNHLRHDGCCAVPAELKQYADDHDISLLTHNDPHPFPVKNVFRAFCNADSPSCSTFDTTWAARYTVWVRCRSIMASKGYLVQFRRKEE